MEIDPGTKCKEHRTHFGKLMTRFPKKVRQAAEYGHSFVISH